MLKRISVSLTIYSTYNIFQFGYVKGDGDVDVTMAELVLDEQIDNIRVLYAYITIIFISVNYNFSL